ncbi:MAG: DUF1700 domain-containing protein [Clostridia bacterium]|nr:DUF1700 domain-containing protein [Clostridia bacterium]
MNKTNFLVALAVKLKGFPEEDVQKSLEYYGEMIDERIEEGMTEEEAVAAVGTVEEIVAQITAETPLLQLLKQKLTLKRKLTAGEKALLICGSPLWFILILASLICLAAVYVSLWAGVVGLFAVPVTFGVGGVGGLVYSVILGASTTWGSGVAFAGASLILIGFTMPTYYACKISAKGLIKIGVILWRAIKKAFVKKGV